jgi:hypothetical protein
MVTLTAAAMSIAPAQKNMPPTIIVSGLPSPVGVGDGTKESPHNASQEQDGDEEAQGGVVVSAEWIFRLLSVDLHQGRNRVRNCMLSQGSL